MRSVSPSIRPPSHRGARWFALALVLAACGGGDEPSAQDVRLTEMRALWVSYGEDGRADVCAQVDERGAPWVAETIWKFLLNDNSTVTVDDIAAFLDAECG